LENKIEKECFTKKFSFLGREYSLNNPNFRDIWGDFFCGARYATLEKYQFPNTSNMNVWHNKHKLSIKVMYMDSMSITIRFMFHQN